MESVVCSGADWGGVGEGSAGECGLLQWCGEDLLGGPIADFVQKRAAELVEDHARLRAAAGSASRVSVEPIIPPDVIGLFVLVPGEV